MARYTACIQARNAAYYRRNKRRLRKQQRAYYAKNREVIKRKNLQHYHGEGKAVKRDRDLKANGWTLSEYQDQHRKQRGRCAICGRKPKRKLHGDHNHKTGKRRGLLCAACNPALGAFGDSVHVLKSAIAYLEKFNRR